ncbi:GDSL-type esterase/lipase family protein [Arsenicibacter rosenii]|uniref:SGNH hydrolase-type esterase domain-containing protein n=1 Tax=Arsenicibacter rosenii TaxID=1750698 RepID=A0A1S2VED9_9BACT|nr:GDSL-type esterase/lipase family protein [Arsenicibacter rosenii]OIN57127.1 hypothetical protein BLX24_21480 [Arsenicibacter rosenii]
MKLNTTRYITQLFLFLFPLCVFAQNKFESDINAFEEKDKTTPPPVHPIVFTGSSSIRYWESLAADFPDKPVLNRGFGGSGLADARYFADRIIIRYQPKQVVLYSGENDVAAGKSAQYVYDQFVDLFQYVRKALPKVSFVYIAMKPSPSRRKYWPVVQEANAMIKGYLKKQKRTKYVDTYTPMLYANGQPHGEYYKGDSLHMLPNGYALWTKLVKPALK